jgi:NAD(P)-dependent dehydrogenase (short-subunit alcohol dehydrogenase family)
MPRESEHSDPRQAGARPPFPSQYQPAPGSEGSMDPPVDHGETSYKGNQRLTGKTAIITGSDSGIGRAVAIAFAREGADLLLSFLPEEEKDAQETARRVEQAGRNAIAVPGDIRDPAYCKTLVEQAGKELGGIDIVVNNAAFQRTYENISDVPAEEFAATFQTNVFGTFYLSQAALPKIRPGGSIINTCSIQAFEPSPQLVAYAPTKAALVSLTKVLAKAAAKQGIRVNGVAPGPVWTPLIPSTMPQEKVKTFGKNTAFERPAQPAELAPIYVFLASQDATYVTGEIYGATGGRTPY